MTKKKQNVKKHQEGVRQNKAKPDCAHLGQLVHCFKPMVHRLGEVDNMKIS